MKEIPSRKDFYKIVRASVLAAAALASCTPDQTPRVSSASSSPQAALGTLDARPAGPALPAIPSASPFESGGPTTGASTETQGKVKTENLGTLEDVARTFGADSNSKNPANWEWAPGEEGFAAHLKPTADFLVTRVNLPNGAVLEGYIDVLEKRENTGFDAVTILANTTQKVVDIRGATIRRSNNPEGLTTELRNKLITKEASQQPGTIILEACPPADLSGTANTRNLGTLADVAARFGMDSFSKNPTNWEWAPGEVGLAAHLKQTPDFTATRVRLGANSVAEGYFDAPERAENTRFNAISWVAHPSQEVVEGRGMTVRDFDNPDAGFAQLARQHIAREAQEQPGAITLLLRKCPGAAPTPTQPPK